MFNEGSDFFILKYWHRGQKSLDIRTCQTAKKGWITHQQKKRGKGRKGYHPFLSGEGESGEFKKDSRCIKGGDAETGPFSLA